MSDERPTIEADVTVTRMETPEDPERDTAQGLVEKVMAERTKWITAWHGRLIDPTKAEVNDLLPEVGAAPGSCILSIEGRIIARFIVRYREDLVDVAFEVDWPRVEPEAEIGVGSSKIGERHRVVYAAAPRGVDWACDELGLEGTSGSVEEMRRLLTSKYGMRFDFVPV